MSGQRILRKFPFALNLGTDICNVIRIRRILESTRGARFVQRILNDEERGHPKIRCILNNGASLNMSQSLSSIGQTVKHHTGGVEGHEKTLSPSKPAPNLDELQLAATFMAGRYDQSSSFQQHLTLFTLSARELGQSTNIGVTRFAAKEAVIKAHPQRNLTWHGITISQQTSTHTDRKGAPAAIIKGTNEDYEALISISHDGDYATAVCLGAQRAGETEE